jgi:hypothetical protein
MKFWVITLSVLLALAAGSGVVSYYGICGHSLRTEGEGDALVWLRSEFKLNDDQIRRIEAMHEAYQDVCAEHCVAIGEARSKVRQLRAAGADEATVRAAELKTIEVDGLCRSSTEAHVRAVAAVMGAEQGARYLAVVLPRLAHVEHTGAPDLQANSSGTHHGH